MLLKLINYLLFLIREIILIVTKFYLKLKFNSQFTKFSFHHVKYIIYFLSSLIVLFLLIKYNKKERFRFLLFALHNELRNKFMLWIFSRLNFSQIGFSHEILITKSVIYVYICVCWRSISQLMKNFLHIMFSNSLFILNEVLWHPLIYYSSVHSAFAIAHLLGSYFYIIIYYCGVKIHNCPIYDKAVRKG